MMETTPEQIAVVEAMAERSIFTEESDALTAVLTELQKLRALLATAYQFKLESGEDIWKCYDNNTWLVSGSDKNIAGERFATALEAFDALR
jgi:hypothetical protein